jgi:putative acetyltransferase
MEIRKAELEDSTSICALYWRVARSPGGLARLESEIDAHYVEQFLQRADKHGHALVAMNDQGHIVGEVHAYTPGLYCFSHVLSDLTIAVDPEYQGAGLGRSLFERFIADVVAQLPEISRIELISRESNTKAILLYESLGFVREGVLRRRIKNMDGSLESDIPMAWTRA